MVYNILTDSIINNVKYKIYDNYPTSKFYNHYFTKVFIINFMSMARATDENDPFKWADFNLIYLDCLIIYQILILKLQQYDYKFL